MFTVTQAPLPGLLTLTPTLDLEPCGSRMGTFSEGAFRDLGIAFTPKEEFYTVSHRGVLRGMHFQVPPADHAKLIYCVTGAVLDVVLDLRRTSPAYGRFHAEELSAANRRIFYIPSGFAHGFLALTEGSLLVYKTNAIYNPACDMGIRWDSFGFDWPLVESAPIISKRDLELPSLAEFTSPF